MTGQSYDLAILGAGPAGLAAAAQASELGLTCVVLDEQAEPGGQIYRALGRRAAQGHEQLDIFGPSYRHGLELLRQFKDSKAEYRPETLVWQVDPPVNAPVDSLARLMTLHQGRAAEIHVARVLICSGAQERPVPVPGWTLPGVLGVGAAQILLKSAGLVPDAPMVIAGNGPLLYLLLAQYREAGYEPSAVLLTGDAGDWAGALPHLPGFLASGLLPEGMKLLKALRQSGTRILRGVRELSIQGTSKAEAVSCVAKGRRESIPASLVCLHEGVVPNTQMTRLIGCAHRWDRIQSAFKPLLDRWGNTTVEGIQVAGDGGGIAGARAAEVSGRIAVMEAARALGKLSEGERDRRSADYRQALSRLVRGRAFVDTLYGPRLARRAPEDATVVCRCEEVTAGQVRQAVREGCQGPNQAKSHLRCGMGPCQGRFCGLAVSQIMAHGRGVSMDRRGYDRSRPAAKPIAFCSAMPTSTKRSR